MWACTCTCLQREKGEEYNCISNWYFKVHLFFRVDGEGSNLELIAGDQSVTLGHSHLEVADFSVSSYSLTGQVATSMASGHRPLPGVSIKATTNQDGAHYQVKTDKDGKFALKSKNFGKVQFPRTLYCVALSK